MLKSNIHSTYHYRLLSGQSTVYLPILHFSLLVYSKLVTKFIEDKGYVLYAKNDF